MSTRLLLAAALAASPGLALASIPPRGFDVPNHTWAATHIIVVEDGKVVESWKGNLKVGDKLPEGAAAYARIRPPAFDKDWLDHAGEKPPVVTGKRMVLFLCYVPNYGEKDPVWMGADCPGFPTHPPSAENVAWIEGTRVYSVGGWSYRWNGGLGSTGGIAALKEEVERGLELQAKFDAAKAERDAGRRVERLIALLGPVHAYSSLWGKHDVIDAVGACGKAAVPKLVEWATDPRTKFRHEAMGALCRIGDDALDAVINILNSETAYWNLVAANLKPGQDIHRLPPNPQSPWRTANGLYHLLSAVRSMKLSPDNQIRVRENSGLVELDRRLKPEGVVPSKSDMATAQEVLRDILAGKFKRDE
jgi:hypothetical protein